MYPSRKAYDPLAFDSFWKPFIRVFQAFGLSHYSILHSQAHVGRLIYFLLLSTCHILLNAYTLKHIHILDKRQYRSSVLMYYVSCLSIIGHFIVHTVAHLEALFSKKQQQEIYQQLREIDSIFVTKLNYVTDFQAYRKKYICHTGGFFAIAAALPFLCSFFSLPNDNSIFVFLLSRFVIVLISRVRRCQIAFHINAVTNILMDLTRLLERQQKSSIIETSSKSGENIKYLREIYTNTWSIAMLISCCFGWSCITFLIEFSIDLINSCYWLYINIKTNQPSYKIIRM